MRVLLAALSLYALGQASALAQAPSGVEAGKAIWNAPLWCKNCHGANGEGGLGPDLAGRNLTAAQFATAVRKPWGIMPAFSADQVSNAELEDIRAYLVSLPAVDKLGAPRFETPANAPHGQQTFLQSVGCGQCHGPIFNGARASIGGMAANFDWFKRMVYDHGPAMKEEAAALGEQAPQRLRMGTYSPSRVPEPVLREIWTWASDLGFRPNISSRFGASSATPQGVTYPFDVANNGLPGKGLTARDMTIGVQLPAGAKVVSTTGAGYIGVRHDEAAKADVAEWKLSKLAPKERQSYAVTLASAGAVKGAVQWKKPVVKTGPSDSVNIGAAPAPR